jgi:ABC-2 type transport system permease protein
VSTGFPSSVVLVARHVRHQNRLFWRTPIGAFFTLVLPLMFLVLFVALFGNDDITTQYGEITTAQFYAPALAVFAAASATYTNIGINLSLQRDEGILKRHRGTPLPPWVYLAGSVGSAIWLALLGVVMMLGVGVVAYGVEIELDKVPAAVVSFAVGVATFALLGLALAAFAPNSSAAPAMANATILPAAFVSGIFVSLGDDPPAWLELIGDILPLKHFAVTFGHALSPTSEAPAFIGWRLGVMALWGLLGAIVAWRRFGWESRGEVTRGRRRRPPT